MEWEGKQYDRVFLTRALPLTDPERFVAVTGAADEEILFLDDLAVLDAASRAAVDEELRTRYFFPVITQIKSIKEKMGAYFFQIVACGADKMVTVKDVSRNIRKLPDGSLIITDTEGNRFLLKDTKGVNKKSLRVLEPYLY